MIENITTPEDGVVLPSAELVGEGRMGAEGVLHVPAVAWSYAALWRLPEAGEGPAIILIDLKIEGGDVGFLCVDESLSTPVADEVFVSPGDGHARVHVPDIEKVHALVVRKGPHLMEPTVVRVEPPVVRSIPHFPVGQADISSSMGALRWSGGGRDSLRSVHAQSEFLRIAVGADMPRRMARIRLRNACPLLGVYPVQDGRMTAGELIYPRASEEMTIGVPLPSGTDEISFRNAGTSTVPLNLEIDEIRFVPFEEVLPDPQLGEEGTPWIFIHTAGKAGSVTLEKSLHHLPGISVSRDHVVNLEHLCGLDTPPVAKILRDLNAPFFMQKASIYRALQHRRKTSDSHWIVTGVRSVERFVLSTIFQNFGASYALAGYTDADAIKAVGRQYDEILSYLDTWWNHEFLPLYGLTPDTLTSAIERRGLIWRIPKSVAGSDILFYRIEDGDAAIREIIAHATGHENLTLIHDNLADDKAYAALYRTVQARFDFDRFSMQRTPFLQRITKIFYSEG